MIVYIGQIEPGGTCRDRMEALRDLGFQIEAFDTTPYLRRKPKLVRAVAHRWNVGLRLMRMNRDLARWVRRISRGAHSSPLVWVDKGRWIYLRTLETIRACAGEFLVHYTPDAQFRLNRSRHFERCVPLYDLLVTTKPFEVGAYRRAGAPRLFLTGQAYDERRASAARWRGHLASDVCFIGHREPHYERMAEEVAREEVTFRVWGPGWSGVRRAFVEGEGLWGSDYYDGLRSTRVGLGLLQKRIPETSTTRSFEIPAAGALLLGERTDEHKRFFEEGVEAEFFDSPEEMRDKVRFYTRHEEARKRIADRGKARCRESGYGNRARMNAVLEALVEDRTYADLRFGVRARAAATDRGSE